MKKLKDIRQENYVSHAQRKAVWAARNDEKEKAKQAAKKAMKKEAVEEKTLTPAEMKKREEIAKAMERENPGMDMKKKMAIATWQAKKVAEAKDPNEYDKEGDMMKNQLRQICSANEKLMKMVGDDDNLPEWVQNKVTKATDYIRSVRDYLDAEDSDEDESMEESVTKMSSPRLKFHATKGVPHGSYTRKEIEDEHKRRMKTEPLYHQVKASLNEETEELDEISDKKLDAYRQKAFADQPAGDDGSDKYRKRKFGRDLAFDKQTGRAKVRATKEEVELDELNKSTLGSYIKKASTNQIGNTAKVLAGKSDPDTERARRRMGQRMSGIAKATDKLTKEEAEQIDELSKKTLGSYVKKAKDDLGNREAEVTRNRYVDPRGVKDPVKHNNALLMKRANRRDNINKAVDQLTKEEVKSSDKKPEKYTRPDGKVAFRMISTDKKIIQND